MRLIAITPETTFEGEADAIAQVLDAGFHTVHLRLPRATDDEARALMHKIPHRYHSKIMLASHYGLDDEFAFGGVHIKQGMEIRPEWAAMRLSRSYHRDDDLSGISKFDYAFLSPVFDSISKCGYHSAFTPQDLRHITSGNPETSYRLVALGGITASRLPEVAAMGFTGAAMLGYLWNGPDTISKRLIEIKEIIKKL